MTTPTATTAHRDVPSQDRDCCPRWCVRAHGTITGEDDWLHTGEPVLLVDGLRAQLAMSVDPETNAVDGPYVLIGEVEVALSEVDVVAASLRALAQAATVLRPARG